MSINLTKLTEDLNIIQSLNDTPTESASELKAKFDEAGNTIKTFINDTLIEEIKTVLNTVRNETLLQAHPVGSYYWSSSSTSPATLFGGTWTQVKDKFILSAGTTYLAGATGGSATHSHTQASTTGSTTLTINQIPAHTHTQSVIRANTTGSTIAGAGNYRYDATYTTNTGSAGAGQGHTHTLGSTNSSSNMPPYEVAYCWKRTA
jgi:hypothetical protein